MSTYYSLIIEPWGFHALSHLFLWQTFGAWKMIRHRDEETGYQILQTSSWIKNQSLQAMVRVAYSLGNKVFFLFSLVSLAILLLKQH